MQLWEQIKTKTIDYVTTKGLDFAKAILVFILGIFVVRLLNRIVKSILLKTKLENVVCKFICSIIKFVLYVLLIMIVLQMLGVNITGILALLTAAAAAVALALQDSLSNLANGIILIASGIFKENDYVQAGGVEGKIVAIGMLTTTICTVDNKHITVPNSKVMGDAIINFSTNPTRRVDFKFGVAYETDVEKAKQIVKDVIMSDGRVRLEPAPFIALKELNDSSITIFANCWVDSGDYWDVYYYVLDTVFNEFKKNNISIPYNQVEVRVREDNVVMPFRKEAIQERVEKERVEVTHKLTDIFHTKNKLTKEEKKEQKEAKKAEKNNK